MLIVNGQRIAGTDRVKDQITFKPGVSPNTSRMPKGPQGAGLHWTGSENGLPTFLGVMANRKLSVQFWQDSDGTLVQLADMFTRCAHMGIGNARFFGVEVRCRGYATKADLDAAKKDDPTLLERDELDWAVARDCYHDTIGGRRVGMAAFSPQQIENLLWLCETTAGTFSFPRAIPFTVATPKGIEAMPMSNSEAYVVRHEGVDYIPLFDRDFRPRGRAATWRGALGHMHINDQKNDPGTGIFYALWAEGWNPAGKKLPGVRLGA